MSPELWDPDLVKRCVWFISLHQGFFADLILQTWADSSQGQVEWKRRRHLQNRSSGVVRLCDWKQHRSTNTHSYLQFTADEMVLISFYSSDGESFFSFLFKPKTHSQNITHRDIKAPVLKGRAGYWKAWVSTRSHQFPPSVWEGVRCDGELAELLTAGCSVVGSGLRLRQLSVSAAAVALLSTVVSEQKSITHRSALTGGDAGSRRKSWLQTHDINVKHLYWIF